MLSDILFENSHNLAEAINHYNDIYDESTIAKVKKAWIELEKIRVQLDCPKPLTDKELYDIASESVDEYIEHYKGKDE